MTDILPFVVAGLATGSLYGLLASGLVITYRTCSVFNFAHGAVAAVGAYLFHTLHVREGMPWPLAALLCVGLLGPVAGLILEVLTRRLADTSPAMKIVSTVGLLLIVQSSLALIYGASTLPITPFLPARVVNIGGTFVGVDQLTIFALASVSAIGLAVFMRSSGLGLAMRGVVDDPRLSSLVGIDPRRVRRSAWVVGSAFAVGSGVLIAPLSGLDPVVLSLLVVPAFGAAAVGRFRSLPLTFAGGLLVGVLASLARHYVGQRPALAGLPAGVPFVVLFGVLLMVPHRKLAEAAVKARRPALPFLASASASTRRWLAVAVLVVAAAVPGVVGPRLLVYISALILAIVLMSLGMLVWTSGQVSLCHAVFVAIGASTASHLMSIDGFPWALAILGGALAAVPAGAVVALPAIRLSGLNLALATLAFGLLAESLLYRTALMFSDIGNVSVPRPGVALLRGDRGFYYLVLATTVGVALFVARLNRSRLGRLLTGLGDSPTALVTFGARTNALRVVVFCIAAFLAGLAGGLSGAMSLSISSVGFGALTSLTWMVVVAIFGARIGIAPAVLGALALVVLPTYISVEREYLTLAFGCLAVLASVQAGSRSGSPLAQRTYERSRMAPRWRRPTIAAEVSS